MEWGLPGTGGRERGICGALGIKSQLRKMSEFQRFAVERCACWEQHCIYPEISIQRVDLLLSVLTMVK